MEELKVLVFGPHGEDMTVDFTLQQAVSRIKILKQHMTQLEQQVSDLRRRTAIPARLVVFNPDDFLAL